MPSFRGSFPTRDRAQVSCVAGILYQLSYQGSSCVPHRFWCHPAYSKLALFVPGIGCLRFGVLGGHPPGGARQGGDGAQARLLGWLRSRAACSQVCTTPDVPLLERSLLSDNAGDAAWLRSRC